MFYTIRQRKFVGTMNHVQVGNYTHYEKFINSIILSVLKGENVFYNKKRKFLSHNEYSHKLKAAHIQKFLSLENYKNLI